VRHEERVLDVTLKKRFHEPGLSGTGRTKTTLRRSIRWTFCETKGMTSDQEFAIMFALPIDEKTFERNRNRQYSVARADIHLLPPSVTCDPGEEARP